MKTIENKGKDNKNKSITKKENEKKAIVSKTEKTNTKVNEILNPTAESRIRKIKNFQLLAEKHEFLKDKSDELENFIVSSDGTKEKIELSNAKGFSFEVSNSQVVEDVLEILKERLKTFTEKSEKEILEYSI